MGGSVRYHTTMMAEESRLLSGFRPGQAVSAEHVLRTLDGLHKMAGSAGRVETLYVPAMPTDDNSPMTSLARASGGLDWIEVMERSCGRALRAHVGIAAFRIGNAGVAFLPSFPLQAALLNDGIVDTHLRSLLSAELIVGVALVRLGRYAVAVYEGRRLAVSKTDTRYVKSRHHAGGTSQRRFQRVRENQIHRLYVEAAGVLERQWQPWLNRLDYVALGGEAATVNGFIKECAMLGRLAPITLQTRLDVREPNRAALDQVAPMLYQCRAYPLRWDG